jgi:hypothetical protein
MKHNTLFRTLAFALILSLLVAMLATPALAAASVTLSLTKGKIGTTVSVSGSGFPESTEVDIYFSKEVASVGGKIDEDVLNYEEKIEVPVDTEGNFSASFKVPDTLTDGDKDVEVKAGTYYFYVTYYGEDLIKARATFTVIVPGISLSPTAGVVGTSVKITGTNFEDGEGITITYDAKDIDIASGNDETGSSGGFTCNIAIPKSTAGKHTITAKIADEAAEAEFTVQPRITITPVSGIIGDSVKVTGTGFVKENGVTITFGDNKVGTDETDTYGSFEANFSVPAVGSGTFDVIAKDEGDNTAQAEFTIATNISLSQVTTEASPGHVGMEMTISGNGFKPNSQINITYATAPTTVATTTSDSNGAFSAPFKIPKSQHGAHTITASDGINTLQANFVMESTAPVTPKLLLPPTDERAKSRPFLDWENVTKDVNDANELSTPLTYDLQIASDADFTNIVLEKTGLPTSEYTLLKGEKLESTKKEAPYYWRVRAVDAASNSSDWTSSRTFYVGSNWGLYCLIGAGVLLIFVLGFWAGRKTKSSYY